MIRDVEKYLKWDAAQMSFIPQLWRREVLPVSLTFSRSDVPTGIATVAAAGTPTPPVSFKQDYSSLEGADDSFGTPFEVRSLVFEDETDGTANADFTLRLREMGEVRDFMNNPIHVRTMVGTAQLPAMLWEPYMMPSQHNLQVQFAKVAGGATNVRMYLQGAQYYPWAPEFLRFRAEGQKMRSVLTKWMNRRRYVTPYWFTSDVTPVVVAAANGTQEAFAKVGGDGPIEVFTLTAVSTGNFALEIQEAKTNQSLMNGRITFTNGIGTAQFPMILSSPYLIPPNMRLRLLFEDLSGNANNTIFFTMGGRKIYAPIRDVTPRKQTFPTAVPTPADSPTLMVPEPNF